MLPQLETLDHRYAQLHGLHYACVILELIKSFEWLSQRYHSSRTVVRQAPTQDAAEYRTTAACCTSDDQRSLHGAVSTNSQSFIGIFVVFDVIVIVSEA